MDSLEDLQVRIDAMAKRIGIGDKIKEALERPPYVPMMFRRAKLYADAKASQELRQARLLATCIADEFERRGLSLDARPAH